MRDWNNFFRIEDFAGLTVDNGFGQESFLTEKSASEIADRANALLREEVGKVSKEVAKALGVKEKGVDG